MVDLAEAFERDSHQVVWVWATDFNYPSRILRVISGGRSKAEGGREEKEEEDEVRKVENEVTNAI